MFKIHYTNGNISNPFNTIDVAINWAKMTSTQFDIIDSDGLVVYRHEEPEMSVYDFVYVDETSYENIRRMNRE